MFFNGSISRIPSPPPPPPQLLTTNGLPIALRSPCAGTFVDARVIGVLDMADEKGEDAKLLAVVDADPRFDEISDLSDIQEHVKIEIQHFFETYKSLEKNKWSKVHEGHGKGTGGLFEFNKTN